LILEHILENWCDFSLKKSLQRASLRINRVLGLNIMLKRATLATIEPKFAAEEPL
jgi:hypothetical protein